MGHKIAAGPWVVIRILIFMGYFMKIGTEKKTVKPIGNFIEIKQEHCNYVYEYV